jgi:hypothetical protein
LKGAKFVKQDIPNFLYLNPPPGLLGRVMSRIEREREVRTIRKRLAIFAAFFAGNLSVSLPVWNFFRADIVRSGLWRYFIILFYDFREVTKFFGDYVFSLLESLPVLSLICFLAVVLAMVYLLKALIKYSRLLYKFSHLKIINSQ